MMIAGVAALILILLGGISYVRDMRNEDADAKAKAMKWLGVAGLFLLVFAILLIVLVVRFVFALL